MRRMACWSILAMLVFITGCATTNDGIVQEEPAVDADDDAALALFVDEIGLSPRRVVCLHRPPLPRAEGSCFFARGTRRRAQDAGRIWPPFAAGQRERTSRTVRPSLPAT